MTHESLTVLVDAQGGQWVAQCVEFDIAAQGDSFDDVMYEFERTLSVQIAMDINQDREPLTHLPPAPERFRKMANAAYRIEEPPLPRFQVAKGAGYRQKTNVRLAELCHN